MSERIHTLKTWPEFYEAIIAGRKTFEVRKDNRGFAEGDTLVLREWDPATGDYTGWSTMRSVAYVLPGGQFGIEDGFCVMALSPSKPPVTGQGEET